MHLAYRTDGDIAIISMSVDHQINQKRHAIRYKCGGDKHHEVSRHCLGDAHAVKLTLDEERGDKKRDGGDYDAQHRASIAKLAMAPIWPLQLIAGFSAAIC